jgi:undecaprenyl-diphosphatase
VLADHGYVLSIDGLAITLAAIGAAALAASVAGARHHEIGAGEQRVFHALNGLPGWLYGVLWLPMQLGNLVVGTAVGLAIAAWYDSWPTAFAVLAATLMKLVAERVVRRRMAGFSDARQRPGTSEVGAILRGDVPVAGPSFPSGHVILVAAIACVVVGSIPTVGIPAAVVLTLAVMLGRVYVGAHNPLDVTGGFGVGLLVGGLLLLLVR